MPLYADIISEDSPERLKRRGEAYKAYLAAISDFLPPETKEFALSEWYYDYSDWDRCPHDAWVESFEIFENFTGERKEKRNVGIRIRLLAASHAAHIQFTYENVFGYILNFSPNIRVWDGRLVLPKHDNWMADEILLDSRGHVVHEIHFSSRCVWKIETERVAYSFIPKGAGHDGTARESSGEGDTC